MSLHAVHAAPEPGDEWGATIPGCVLPETRYGTREALEHWVDVRGFTKAEARWFRVDGAPVDDAPPYAVRIANLHRCLAAPPYAPSYTYDVEDAAALVNGAERAGGCHRFLLVERESGDRREGRRIFTIHRSPWDAFEYAVGQEHAADWEPAGLVDLDTCEPLRLYVYGRANVQPTGETVENACAEMRDSYVEVIYTHDPVNDDEADPWDLEPDAPEPPPTPSGWDSTSTPAGGAS